MKIAFCGDSFCLDIFNFNPGGTVSELINPVFNPKRLVPFEPYPYLVAKEFNAKILCSGQGGGTLYNSYEVLMKYIQEADYIVYCITDAVRLNNKYRLPLSVGNTNYDGTSLYSLALWNKVIHIEADGDFNITKQEEKELRVAVKSYYKMIFDEDCENIRHRALLREIDTVIKEYKKKCIFFESFGGSFHGYTPENVVWGNLSLHHDIQILQKTLLIELTNWAKSKAEYRPNHFTEQNNKNMANFIIDVIKQDDFTPRELDMRKYFK
jgi:hypothetical protein